jgi:hypothetical protein
MQSADQAAQYAMQAPGIGGYGTLAQGTTTFTGLLTPLSMGQEAPLMMTYNGEIFRGIITPAPGGTGFSRMVGHSDNGRGYTSLGVTTFQGNQSGQFSGQTRSPEWSFEGTGEGRPSALEAQGVGVFILANGQRYEGEYRTVGIDVIMSKQGWGILYSANGDVLRAGRWENDRFSGN